MSDHKVPFNRPYMTGRELAYIAEAHSCGHLAGDGPFTRRSHAWLEQQTGCRKALLTPSCTAALEMMALLLDIEEGDEVILPSYTLSLPPTPSCCAVVCQSLSIFGPTRSTLMKLAS